VNEKTIATIALRDGEYDSLQQTLDEAARLVKLSAAQGVDLVVLPETINLLHRRDDITPLHAFALDDWQTTTSQLCETAIKAKVALVLPLLVRSETGLANCFFFLDRDGSVLGRYQKIVPSPGEAAAGVGGKGSSPIPWEGLAIGGGICFDVYYPQAVFDPQMAAGVDCFLIPSMTPGGTLINAYAIHYGVPFVLAYSAWSRLVDRDGYELAAGGYRSETLRAGYGTPIQQAAINFDAVSLFADVNQSKIQDIQRHFGEKVRIRFDQPNCNFLLESLSTDLTVAEIMRQFGLVSRRDYFAQHAPATITSEQAKHSA
jgi:predicted amidohydrolase